MGVKKYLEAGKIVSVFGIKGGIKVFLHIFTIKHLQNISFFVIITMCRHLPLWGNYAHGRT